jgi:myo-inositol-1(or 4)-monophosphatase
MNESDYQPDPRFREVAESAARAAGRVITDKLRTSYRVSRKGKVDLVTEADIEAEEKIIAAIRAEFPLHRVVGEESGIGKERSDFIWYVDPLDGTTNFAHGYPHYSVSIALQYRRRTVLGVVFDPGRGELFSAELGGGAFLNGKHLSVSSVRDPQAALLATGFPYELEQRPRALDFLGRVLGDIQGIRRDGSAALNLSYVAAGRLDGYWELSLHPWDCAAGALLVEEAGGRVSGTEGRDFDIQRPEILAGNPFIHSFLVRALGDVETRGPGR